MTAEIEEIYTLSPLQQGLLFHTLYAPESGDYFGQSSCRLKAALNVHAFQHAWERVVERHSILRTSFVWEMTDEPLQVVHRRCAPPFLHLDWSTLSSAEQEAQLEQYLEEDRRRGFDLGEAPLMRLALMSLGGDGYYFVWSHHHLLLDGWSGPVLFKEVFTFYEAERTKTKVDLPQPRPYKDYIAWLQGRQQDSTEAEAFWRHRLKGFARPTPLGIVKLANESSRQSKSRAERQIELSEQCTSDLVTFARENKLTMNTLVQGAWSLLLSRYSGDQDVLFGTTVSGRPTDLPGVETMVGLFINSLPVRVRLSGDELLLPWLKNLQEEQVEAREFSHCVLVDIQGWSDVPRGLTLFDTLLVFENYPGESSLDRQIQSLEISDYSFIGTTNFPITLVTVPGRTLILQILFDRSRVEGEAIERLLQNLQTVLESMAKGPDQHLSDISYLSNEERRLLTGWNQTQRDFPAETCIHELFTQHAERQPDAIAIIHQNTCLSYGKLDRQANRIANYLRRKGVGHEALVGIFMERSPQVVKCLLGIMKAGGAYVPLDPGYPKDRLAFMLRDAGVSVVLTEEHLLPALPKHDAQVVCIDTDLEQIARESATEVANVATADSAAYVIYTSGTTGRPKGVVVEHRGVINLARWQRETFGISSASRVAQSFSYSFDGAVGETAMSLLNGATMVMLELDQLSPNQLVAALNEYRINVAVFVPSLISQIDPHSLQHGSELTIVSVGEACPPHLAREWSRNCTFINAYGPTEYTVYSHLYKVDGEEVDGKERVPIGKPLHNTESFILDANLEPTPVGVSGEICISGVGLARTYLNRPDITAQRFAPNRSFFENSTIDHKKIRLESALAEINVFKQEMAGRISIGRAEALRDEASVLQMLNAPDLVEATREFLATTNHESAAFQAFRRYLIEGVQHNYAACGINADVLRLLFPYEEYEGLEGVDFCFGNSEIMAILSGMGVRVTGFDLNPLFVKAARARGLDAYMTRVDVSRDEFIRASGIDEGSKDFALTTLSLDRVEKPGNLLANMFRILKEGGRFAVQTLLPIVPVDDGDLVDRRVTYTPPENRITTGDNVSLDRLYVTGLLYELGARDIQICRLPYVVASSDGVQEYDVWSFFGRKIRNEEASASKNYFRRIYRTGDLGRYLTDGSIEFLGRLDHQVKLRGFRIELEEIENTLQQHPDVRDAVVVMRKDPNGNARLVAYVTSVTPSEPTDAEIRAFLSERLPEYMVPAVYVHMKELPLTPVGKADRNALPEPEAMRRERQHAQLEPRTPVEEVLAGIWEDVLGLAHVGLSDNFFELGGHSLIATQVASRLAEYFKIEISLPTLFDLPTIKELATEIETKLKTTTPAAAPDILPISREGALPLSYAQQRLWFLDQLDPGGVAYNISIAVRITGTLKIEALEQALTEVVRRHEALRTRFESVEGRPVQVIDPLQAVKIPVIDLSTEAKPESEVKRLAQEEEHAPFDLSVGPLLRMKLLRLSEQEHVGLLTVHHIVVDGWSMGILMSELAALYEAYSDKAEPALEDLAIQYADYAAWQRDWLEAGALETQLAYWRQQLEGSPALLELPIDKPRPATRSYRGAAHKFALDAELTEKLKDLGRREGVTAFMSLLAAWAVLLGRLTGQDEVNVGTPIAGRTRKEIEGLIGLFVNTLVMRVRVSPSQTIEELLAQVRDVALNAYMQQDLPFEKLVDELQPVRDMSRAPLFETMFVIQNTPGYEIRLRDLTFSSIEPAESSAKFDLMLDIAESDDRVHGSIRYSTELFNAATIEMMAQRFKLVLEAITGDAELSLSEIELLSAEERRQLLVEWNETEQAYEREATVPELFERQVSLTPEAIAVVDDEQQLSYCELETRAKQLARYLRRYRVGPESLVGVFLERGVEAVVALLGIMKAGGAYVPVDPSYPAERVAWMLADAGVAVVVTNEQLARVLPAQVGQLVLVDQEAAAIAAEEGLSIESGVGAENLAYVIYTSGSTGRPKGVMICHRSVSHLVTALERRIYAGHENLRRVGLNAPLTFDGSVKQLVQLLQGRTLVLVPEAARADGEALVEFIEEREIEALDCTPGQLRLLQAAGLGERCASLTAVLVGGEAVSAAVWEEGAVDGGRRYYNVYGPTECTVDATVGEFESGVVHIGRLLANVHGYVVERSGMGRLAPIGVAGELYLGGAGLARGYLNRPELTAERFLPDPFSITAGARLYRTGDLARYVSSGNIEFLGRVDEQVKVRGYRIEPGEIEAVLCEQPSLAAAAVIAREDEPGRRRLVAYLVAAAGLEVPEAKQLREALSERLPDYMIPSHFITLDKLPLTANGKLDRRALPAPQSVGTGESVAPETENERLLCQVWAEVLGRATVGVTDNFFELGGDSILSIQIVARANRAGVRLTPKDLFRYQTVRELAGAVTTGAATEAGVPGEQGVLQGSVPLTPIQQRFFEQQLPARHHNNQAVLLEVKAGVDCSRLEEVLAGVLRQHDALRLRFAEVEDGGWRQWYAAEEAVELSRYDLSGLSESERIAELGRTAERLQRELNLEHGPVMRAAYYDYGAGRAGRLLLLAHHLVVDGVSWRVLLGDWVRAHEQVVRGETLELGAKSCSYRQWSERLAELGRSGAHLSEAEYWLGECAGAKRSLPVDDERGSRREQDAGAVVRRVSAAVTRRLLTGAVEGYRAHVQELLLAGLGRVLSEWVGAEEVAVALEGHGREQEWVGLDVSQTVGWFTTVYPVAVGRRRGESRGETVRRMKERLRAIPHGGLGYGVLRYLSGDDQLQEQLREAGKTAVSFNYLGQFDGVMSGGAGWYQAAAEYGGELRDGAGEREYELDVSGRVLSGELELRWAYGRERYRAETIERLADRYVQELEALAAEGAAEGVGSTTALVPSDFPLAKLDQRTLEVLINKNPDLEDVYRVAPLQQGLLFHTLYAPDAGDYFGQLSCVLRALDVAAFKRAWELIVERHSILHTSFVWEMTDEPLQVVHRNSPPPFLHLDWSALPRTEQEARLQQYLEEDRRRGFDLTQAPLMRLVLMSLGSDEYYFVWSHHHLLLDGWSGPVLFKEVFTLYEAERSKTKADLPQPRPYKEYIAWLDRQNKDRAEAFWRRTLRGLSSPPLLGKQASDNGHNAEQRRREAHPRRLTMDETLALQNFARRHQLTLNTLMQGAWSVLLSRYTGEQDVVFGVATSGRPADLHGVETMVGIFVNTLPVRVKIDSSIPLIEWLQNLQQQQAQMRQFEYASLVEIQKWSEVPGGRPLFDTIYGYGNHPVDESLGDFARNLGITQLRTSQSTHYPLTILAGTDPELSFRLLYDSGKINAAKVEWILTHLEILLLSLMSKVDWYVLDVPLTNGRPTGITPQFDKQADIPPAFATDQFNFEI